MKEGEVRVHLVIVLNSVLLRLHFLTPLYTSKGQVFSVKVSQEGEGHVSVYALLG